MIADHHKPPTGGAGGSVACLHKHDWNFSLLLSHGFEAQGTAYCLQTLKSRLLMHLTSLEWLEAS